MLEKPGRNQLLVNSVERYIKELLKKKGAIQMTLIDPQKTGIEKSAEIAIEAEKGGTSAIMVGGSTLASNDDLDKAIQDIKKKVSVPIILFPNNISGVSRYADAIWFMSLLNSASTYYLIDVQALTAFTIKKYGLEAISMGYIIIGDGGAAGYVGQARGIPYNHPELALGYSLAAETLGMRFVYLEAGSGAKAHVPIEMIKLVNSQIKVPLIVGGGIRDGKTAKTVVDAGADIIVTGTLVEETKGIRESIYDIISHIE
jgi:phosphoglycerol geranylgeranyltransferase